jgi:hypothetical protein
VAHVSLDRPGELRGRVRLELREIESGVVLESVEAPVWLREPGAVDAAILDVPAGLARRRHALVATLQHEGGVARDFRYLVPLADIEGLGGKVSARRSPEGVTVTSSGWRLRVGVESYESPAIWSDNYFDLLPGESRTLHLSYGAPPTHLWLVAGMGQRVALPETGEVEL